MKSILPSIGQKAETIFDLPKGFFFYIVEPKKTEVSMLNSLLV